MKLRATLQLFVLSAVWGVSFLMMRIADPTIPPVWVAGLRCGLGAAMLWAMLLFGGHALPPRRVLPWLLLVALLNNAVPFTFFAWGEQSVPSNIAAVINATTPIWTLLMSLAIERARPTTLTIAGVLLSFAGIVIVVVTHGTDHAAAGIVGGGGPGMLGGTLIIGSATLGYGLATVVAKARLRGLDPIGLATGQLSLATLLLLPFAVLGPHPSAWEPGALAAVAVLGFAGSGVAYVLYYRLLSQISATQLAAVTYLLPIWGLFWGLFAHEAIGIGTCVGVAVTIGGLVLLNLRALRAAPTAGPTSPRRSSAPAAAGPE